MGRYTRDEVLLQGLDLAASPIVSKHDAPGGVISPDAYSIKWLQNALDYFHRKFPFANDIVEDLPMIVQPNTGILVLASDPTKYLPTDFILDVRNGIFIQDGTSRYRIVRKDFQRRMQGKMNYQGVTNNTQVFLYTLVNNKILTLPVVTESKQAFLNYYALPPVLEAEDNCNFPDEFVLIEFIRIKTLEWSKVEKVGTAQLYLQSQLGALRASGLLHDPEYNDAIPIENNQVVLGSGDYTSWMGRW